MTARPEQAIQQAIVGYLRLVLPASHKVLHLRNNPRSRIAGGVEKRMGAIAGIPDLCVLRPAQRIAWIEVKAPRGSLTKEQRDFQSWCREQGHPHAVCRSVDDARDFIEREQFPTREAAVALASMETSK